MLREGETFEQAQDLPHGEAAGGRRTHAAHPPGAIRGAYGRTLDRPITRQILVGELRRRERRAVGAAACVRPCHQGVRERPRIEGIRSGACQFFQRAGVGRIGEDRAHGLYLACGSEQIGAGLGVELQPAGERLGYRRQSWRKGESLLGQPDRRGEEFGPRATPLFGMRALEQSHQARRADGAPLARRASNRSPAAVSTVSGKGEKGRRGDAQQVGRIGGQVRQHFVQQLGILDVGQGFAPSVVSRLWKPVGYSTQAPSSCCHSSIWSIMAFFVMAVSSSLSHDCLASAVSSALFIFSRGFLMSSGSMLTGSPSSSLP